MYGREVLTKIIPGNFCTTTFFGVSVYQAWLNVLSLFIYPKLQCFTVNCLCGFYKRPTVVGDGPGAVEQLQGGGGIVAKR